MSSSDFDASFRLHVLGSIADYQREIAKLPDVTGKQAAAAALRMEREMVKAAANTGKAAQGAASGGATALGKAFGQAKEQVALVAAGAARISPELGNVVNTASAAVGVFKSMASSMGAIAAVGTAVAAAFVKASSDLDKAKEKANEVAKTAIKAQLGIVDSSNYVNKAIEDQERASVLRRQGYWRDWARSALDSFDVVLKFIPGVQTATDSYRKELDRLDDLQNANIATAEASRDQNIKLAQAEQDAATATKKHAGAVDDLTEAMRKEVQDTFEAKDEARTKDSDATKAANTAEMKAAMEVYEINKALRDKQTKADEEAHEKKLDYQMDAIDAAANLGSSIVAVGKAMFGDSKEIAYAGAIIDTAAGIAKALGSAPPPLNFVNAAAVGIVGAAEIATIASTNIAHSGLAFNPAQSMAPDETSWKLRRNEGVLTERGVRGVGGYDQIRKLNAGQAPSMGGRFVGITKWQHKAMDTAIGANVSRPAAVRTEMKAIASTGGRVGHRLRSST